MNFKKVFGILLLFAAQAIYAQDQRPLSDMLIFSFDRPMQLYALLESMERYLTGVDEIEVIYRASNDDFGKAYEVVASRFPAVKYSKQGSNPHADFKPLTIGALDRFKHEYIIFAVDDIIMTDYVDLRDCIDALEKYKAYGFYLRLGTHLTECYTMNRKQPVPAHTKLENSICAWRFSDGMYDWNYPNTVDLTLYKKSHILPDIKATPFKAPNTLEGNWDSQFANAKRGKIGLCYEHTKMVNLPLNLAQQECNNRHMNALSTQDLLAAFNAGFKIALDPLFQYTNKAAHVDYIPELITR